MAVADLPEPRVIPSLKQAWTNIWPQFWWLLLFGVLAGLATGINAGSEAPVGPIEIYVNTIGSLISFFVGVPLSIGLTKAHLAASRGEKPTWNDLGYAFSPRYGQSLLLGLLSFLIVIGGLILLIIPGIYWGVKLLFTHQRFIEDDLDAVGAIKASFADVKGRWWSVFGLVLLAIPLYLAGLLALLVGVFVALVLIEQMFVVYWRATCENADRAPPAMPPADAS